MPEPVTSQILIVDDARSIREPLAQYLRKQGFRTLLAADAAAARRALAESVVHLVVLDIMMPGEDGLSLCRALAGQTPVILLTARAAEDDRIEGLELGADDYVTKPFNPRELVARIRSILRRTTIERPPTSQARRAFAGLVHDAAAGQVMLADGTALDLTTGENRLLSTLLDHPNEVLSRIRLMDLLHGRDAKPYDRTVDNAISRLRRKIGDGARPHRIIATEWGGGYRLAAQVDPVP